MVQDNQNSEKEIRRDFIREIVAQDIAPGGRFEGQTVHTRFPPEPNAYLHIGHAKAVWIDYGIAEDFGGLFNLRFDDTNPAKEEQEFVDAIIEDVRWLGAKWDDRLFFASDYFEQMYEWAVELIKKGMAYVCDLTGDEVTQYRGTLTRPGKNSPYRDRSIEENLELFTRMRKGEFPDGSRTLRAKIDMAHPNLNMRDPIMYRILHEEHHRQGNKWCIYPMYDWAHGFEDSIEGITHSLCSLEYENHRPLYDWFIDAVNVGRTDDGSGPWGRKINHPRQIEFARLNLTYTVMSKRKFIDLVKGGFVNGFDDPRLPTLAGLRRRGYTPEAIKNFCKVIGINKFYSVIDVALLEHCLREDLNKTSSRVMAVLKPLKVIIDNYPENKVEQLDAINNPEEPSSGTRKVPFGRELYIERDDFMEVAPPKFYRLAPGREVRLRYAYFIKCVNAVKDNAGNIVELHCTYDPATKGGDAPDGRKVKSTIHWLSAKGAIPAEVRLYDTLFTKENPDDIHEDQDFTINLNPKSLEVLTNCLVEPSLKAAKPSSRYQFERLGYFCVDPDTTPDKLIFNRTVTLRDEWAKIQKAQKPT
jgi:glutaminyl-tRNA synthetase